MTLRTMLYKPLFQVFGYHMLLWDDLKHIQRYNELRQHMFNYTDMCNQIAFPEWLLLYPNKLPSVKTISQDLMTSFIHMYSNPGKMFYRNCYCNNFLEIKIVWNFDKIAWGNLIAHTVAPFTHFGTIIKPFSGRPEILEIILLKYR